MFYLTYISSINQLADMHFTCILNVIYLLVSKYVKSHLTKLSLQVIITNDKARNASLECLKVML
jgi:hypothetical protein